MHRTERLKSVKVISIKHIGKQPVFNMEVEKHHNFCVNGGLVVHNCFDSVGYALLAYHKGRSKPVPRELNAVEKDLERILKAKTGQTRRLS